MRILLTMTIFSLIAPVFAPREAEELAGLRHNHSHIHRKSGGTQKTCASSSIAFQCGEEFFDPEECAAAKVVACKYIRELKKTSGLHRFPKLYKPYVGQTLYHHGLYYYIFPIKPKFKIYGCKLSPVSGVPTCLALLLKDINKFE